MRTPWKPWKRGRPGRKDWETCCGSKRGMIRSDGPGRASKIRWKRANCQKMPTLVCLRPVDKIKSNRWAVDLRRAVDPSGVRMKFPSLRPAGPKTKDRPMSENDLPPEVIADILEVLRWIMTHPNGKREDMGELFDVYKKWRALIFKLKLLDDTGNQRTVAGLS